MNPYLPSYVTPRFLSLKKGNKLFSCIALQGSFLPGKMNRMKAQDLVNHKELGDTLRYGL